MKHDTDCNVVQGSHKHRLMQCLHENGDPLAHKRAKYNPSSAVLTATNLPTTSPALQVIEGARATARNIPAATMSHLSLQGPITANLTNNGHSDGLDILYNRSMLMRVTLRMPERRMTRRGRQLNVMKLMMLSWVSHPL